MHLAGQECRARRCGVRVQNASTRQRAALRDDQPSLRCLGRAPGGAADASSALTEFSAVPAWNPFSVSGETEGITFSFNQWAFDFIRTEWTDLGLPDFEKELDSTDELDDVSFERLLKTAIARLRYAMRHQERAARGRFSARRVKSASLDLRLLL